MAERRKMGFYEARNIMAAIGCELNADFHRLDSNQVSRVLMEARQYGYRKPKNANGSRARYFFAFVQRTAHRKIM
jgi:hypothetical protein